MVRPRRGSGHSVDLADFVAEQAMLLGAGSAVLNQLARKGVGLGVAEHSTTLKRPIDRLRTTLTYVYVMALGTDEERRIIARLVNRAHAEVRSPGRYSAFDPELQLWVAATLAHSGLFIYERTFGPLDPASRERIYQQSKVFGNALQVRDEMWPATLVEFEQYWSESLDRMESDPAVRAYVTALLSRKHQPLVVQLLLPLQSLVTRGNVDARVRAVHDLPWTRRDQALYDLFWKVFPPVYRACPRWLRQLNAHLVLRGMRRRLRTGRRVM